MSALFKPIDFLSRAISPLRELGAYEALWQNPASSFKNIAAKFKATPDSIPSDFVAHADAIEVGHRVMKMIKDAGVSRFGIRVHGANEYPKKLRDAEYPIELLYYSGLWELVETPSVSVVGARDASEDGLSRAKKLVQYLVKDGYTIVSGLAKGIDTIAHKTAIECGGNTMAVIGTPLTSVYPADNSELQKEIANRHLVISQVPILRYSDAGKVNPVSNRYFFPERNITMSALTEATVIVEASETSGTLHQARAALKQGRKLFILDSLFRRSDLTWPAKFEARGAIRVRDYNDIRSHLKI